MYPVEAKRSAGVRFSTPCHIPAFVGVCVCMWCPLAQKNHQVVTGDNLAQGKNVFRGILYRGATCFGAFVPGGFLTGRASGPRLLI